MTPAPGQILRRIGLLIEAACVLGILNEARVRSVLWQRFRVDPGQALWVGLALGFVLWVTGTAAIFAGRKSSRTVEK